MNHRYISANDIEATGLQMIGRWKPNNQHSICFTSKRRFREMFGCCPKIAAAAWNKIEGNIEWTGLTTYSSRSTVHLLWALLFLKVYGKEATLSSLVGGVDEKTFRKWVWLYIAALSSLESFVVSNIL
jgi:hypothetical protein